MFGINDPQIIAAIFGCILITLAGVIYGTVNWNKGDDPRKEFAHFRHRRRRQYRRRTQNQEGK